jgi:hypothetical protein
MLLDSIFVSLLLASITYGASLSEVRNQWVDPYSLRPNPLYLYPRSFPSRPSRNTPIYRSRLRKDSDHDVAPSRTRRPFRLGRRQDPSETAPQELDTRPTPQATGEPSVLTTVFVNSENDFALLLPATPGGTLFAHIFFVHAPQQLDA